MRLESDSEFWEVRLDDHTCVIRTGRIGTRGKSARTAYATLDDAQRAHDDAVVAALKAGFAERDAVPPSGLDIRNAALEQAIRDHRDDREAYLVYADWLQTHGNPIGELVALAIRLDGDRKDPRQAKRFDALRAALRLPLPDRVTTRSRWGLWRSVRLESIGERAIAARAAPDVFAHVMCAALDELVIGTLQWGQDHALVPRVLETAGRHAWSKDLRRLQIGPDDPAKPDTIFVNLDYDAGKLGPTISSAFPGLETLRVHGGVQKGDTASTLANLALPELRELVIVGGWFGTARYQELVSMTVPKLRRLELWLGGGPGAEPADPTLIAGLFANGRFATVRELALRNSRFADAFAAALPGWPIARTLETLDLAYGTLSDDGARALLVNPRKLAALQHLVVDRSYLSHDAVRALAARFPNVSAADQRAPTTANQRVSAFLPDYARLERLRGGRRRR